MSQVTTHLATGTRAGGVPRQALPDAKATRTGTGK